MKSRSSPSAAFPEASSVKRILLSWSSGKDSAWTLHVLSQNPDYRVCGLLTTINRDHRRVMMHGVREDLLDAQAAALGLPLVKIDLPSRCSNEEYESAMGHALERARADGVEGVAFGDLHLEDVRRYREEKLAGSGITPIFPLWGTPTRSLADAMVESGLLAYVTAVDLRALDRSFAGRLFDREFLDDLPAGADPCGENGEFHSFACAGPMFPKPLPVARGEVVEREGFAFCDLLPGG
jgi:uncharacterized protein (TIGR00290 family)